MSSRSEPLYSKYGFENRNKVYRAFLIEVGDARHTAERSVPHILDAMASSGGLFEILTIFGGIINFLLFDPIAELNLLNHWSQHQN